MPTGANGHLRGRQLKYARKNEEFELRRAFLKLDKNNDNKIDADELAACFNSLGHKVKKVRRCEQSNVICAVAFLSAPVPRGVSPQHVHTGLTRRCSRML